MLGDVLRVLALIVGPLPLGVLTGLLIEELCRWRELRRLERAHPEGVQLHTLPDHLRRYVRAVPVPASAPGRTEARHPQG